MASSRNVHDGGVMTEEKEEEIEVDSEDEIVKELRVGFLCKNQDFLLYLKDNKKGKQRSSPSKQARLI